MSYSIFCNYIIFKIKFYVKVLYIHIHNKTNKLWHKKLLDRQRYTSFKNIGYIRLAWPLFDNILFLNPNRDGIIISRGNVPGESKLPWCKDEN